MKRIIFFCSLFLALQSSALSAQRSTAPMDLNTMEEMLNKKLITSYEKKNNSEYPALIKRLDDSYNSTKNDLYLYWKAYAQFHNSVIYKHKSNDAKAKTEIESAIETLESIKTMKSDDYALLSLVQLFSCQFIKVPRLIFRAKSAKSNAEKAIKLDPKNIRAYYVYASLNYNMPENHGGRVEVEEYAMKALAQPDQSTVNPQMPVWGRELVYEMLTSFYIEEMENAKAQKYVDEGLKIFPESKKLKANNKRIPK